MKKLFLLLLIPCLCFCACSSKEKTEYEKIAEESIGEEDIVIMENIKDDTTGKWRYSSIVSPNDATEWAADYCRAYFKSDDEIHFILNFGNNTTNVIRKLTKNHISLSIREHVEHEERSAKTLGDGMQYAEYMVNLETGEVEKLSE